MMKPQDTPRPAVFLDRDGTLNQDSGYTHQIEDFAWIAGAPEAIRRLNERGLLVFVVTNQAGVARGFYAEEDVQRFHQHMQASLKAYDAWIDAFYYCPYHPEGTVAAYRRVSPCRKPATGMLDEAIAAFGVAPTQSFMVGDRNSDIEAGRSLGMTTFLVETGYGSIAKATTQADYIVADIGAATDFILRQTQPALHGV